jgi:hypothetical protein
MIVTDHEPFPAGLATAGDDEDAFRAAIASAVQSCELRDFEIIWSDHQGRARGWKVLSAASTSSQSRYIGTLMQAPACRTRIAS